MTLLYDSRAIRAVEQLAADTGIDDVTLMERAGLAAFSILTKHWPAAQKIIICTGKGNNGGDGFVLARLLHDARYTVVVYALAEPHELKGPALKAAQACQRAGVVIEPFAQHLPYDADLIVDALLGTGLSGEVRGPYITLINAINEHNSDVLSLDVPSGLNADTGAIEGAAVDADLTLTFIGYKAGMFTLKGPSRCGEVVLAGLDLPSALLASLPAVAEVTDWTRMQQVLPKRCRDAHKGDYGHVLVVGGDYGMGGAVRMAAEGALRVGAGLASVATRPEHVSVVSTSRPEIMCHQVSEPDEVDVLLERATVLVIGPGLGTTPWAEGLLERVLATNKPLLLDADALNLLSQQPRHQDNWVLTPHPGEAARLLQCSCQELQLDRFAAVRELQRRYGGVVVLKGAGTLIKGPGPLIKLCRAGNPGMATGGMGDILSGIIGGLMAQGLDAFTAAEVGVYVHARAADLAVAEGGERGLLATDVLSYLRQLVNPN